MPNLFEAAAATAEEEVEEVVIHSRPLNNFLSITPFSECDHGGGAGAGGGAVEETNKSQVMGKQDQFNLN